jgi:hypothetical protein
MAAMAPRIQDTADPQERATSRPPEAVPAASDSRLPALEPASPNGIADIETVPVPAAMAAAAEKSNVVSAPPDAAVRRPAVTKRLTERHKLVDLDEPPAQPVQAKLAKPAALSAPDFAPSSATAPAPGAVRPRPLPEPDVLVTVAGVHAALATAGALVGAALLVASQPSALWALAFTAIVGLGGWVGYALAQGKRTHTAVRVLLISQVAALAWLLALVGPRPSVLALAPIPALLALRLRGRGAATLATLAPLALYIVASPLVLTGVLLPALVASPAAYTVLDIFFVGVGLLTTLAGIAGLHARQARAEAAARARLYELRVQRTRSAELRQQIEEDADSLARSLLEALRGQGIQPLQARGTLSPLAESVMAVAERMQTLQQDREDRLRIEAALRAITREVERAWLGLPWVWPQPSGTALDELVALLRAPRPADSQAPWTSETPTLVPIPTLDTEPVPRILPRRISSPDLSHSRVHMGALPWSEWDEWRGWDPLQQRQDSAGA